MQMTLRQAHKMVEKINGRMTKISIQANREIGIWNMRPSTIPDAQAEFEKELARQINLTNVRQAIRQGIQVANRAEVDAAVALRKATLDQIGILRAVVAGVDPDNIYTSSAINDKVAAAKQAASINASAYGRDSVTVCVITPERLAELNQQIDLYQLKLEAIEDQLTAANADRANLVTITEEDAEVLRQENLIA